MDLRESTEEFSIKKTRYISHCSGISPIPFPVYLLLLPYISYCSRISPITHNRDSDQSFRFSSKFLGFPCKCPVSRALRSPINLLFAPVYLPFPFFCHEAPRSMNLGFHLYWDFDPRYISYSPPHISHYHLKMGNIRGFCCCSVAAQFIQHLRVFQMMNLTMQYNQKMQVQYNCS